jgi:hypothetical protein
MKLPHVDEPAHYRGLYLVDFGEWTAVGYTAEEVALLAESEQYRGAKVYKIVRATPDGRFELRGVAPERFQVESGMLFVRDRFDAARDDFDQLRDVAEKDPPPCRAFLHLADRGPAEASPRYVTALIYPAEYEDEVARWLGEANYAGGDVAEGGVSHVTNYYDAPKTIIERQQLWSRTAIPSRSREELYASVRRAVQR